MERLRRALVFSWIVAVLLTSVLVIGYVLWGGAAQDRPNRAQVSGTLLAAAVIVPPAILWVWRRLHRTVANSATRQQVEAAADLLAMRTFTTWSQEAVQRGIQAPAPVKVRWHWAPDDVALRRDDLVTSPSLPTDPGPLPPAAGNPSATEQALTSGVVTRLHDELYGRLNHGRLALIGGAGAGKTGAMILLLLEALQRRQRAPDAARVDIPVPVWLTLGSWEAAPQTLRDWVMSTLNRDHPYLRASEFGPDAVAQLFDAGHIALFLDGLDEMPDATRGAALDRLTAEVGGRRAVLTSRPAEFRGTLQTGRQRPYTAVIELRPVHPPAAAEYLLEGHIGQARQGWKHVADHLLAQPDGILAQTLNTPLTLSLARSAYKGSDPGALLISQLSDEQSLQVNLLDEALVAAYPDPGERTHALYWLGWLDEGPPQSS
jgi:hypothetical protein